MEKFSENRSSWRSSAASMHYNLMVCTQSYNFNGISNIFRFMTLGVSVEVIKLYKPHEFL